MWPVNDENAQDCSTVSRHSARLAANQPMQSVIRRKRTMIDWKAMGVHKKIVAGILAIVPVVGITVLLVHHWGVIQLVIGF